MLIPIANLLAQPLSVAHYMVVGAVLFVCGVICMATKRNALGVLMGIELVLNGANINLVAMGSPYLRSAEHTLGLDGQLMAMFVIVLAAAEAAIALAIALNFYNNYGSIDVDRANNLKG
jgi:NADH:ubiquinone oxidoreductase subunit K